MKAKTERYEWRRTSGDLRQAAWYAVNTAGYNDPSKAHRVVLLAGKNELLLKHIRYQRINGMKRNSTFRYWR